MLTILEFGDYVFFNASNNGISPLDGITAFLQNSSSPVSVSFSQGCELWSSDTSGFDDAISTATAADANEVCGEVRHAIAEEIGAEVAEKTRIQYGGSVKPANVEELLSTVLDPVEKNSSSPIVRSDWV